jgi:L-fuculose-phosphate aldolase
VPGAIALRREIVTVCQRLWARGLIAGPDGNVSVRLSGERILVTPAGMSKVDVRPDDLVEVRLDGHRVRGVRRPSTELAVHLRIYSQRPDVGAIVHAHPPVATGFAVAGEGFASCILPEVIFQMGWVPLVPYEMPGTEALARQFDPFIPTHDAFLMANHGAVTAGPTLSIAHQRMESLEHTARILLTSRLLGRVNELSADQVAALVAARGRAGVAGPYPGCPSPDDQRRHE